MNDTSRRVFGSEPNPPPPCDRITPTPMIVWVLMNSDRPIRAYTDEARANEDMALMRLVSSESDYWHLESCEAIGNQES